MIYASLADLRAYAPEIADRDDAVLEAAIDAAEKDVDDYAGFYTLLDTGRKFDVTDPLDATVVAIKRATCAQARYRLYMGPVFFIEQQQYKYVGGDISASKPSRFSPEMRSELPDGFRKLLGRFV